MRYLLLCFLFFAGLTQSTSVLAQEDWLKNAYDGSHNNLQNPYSASAEASDLFNTQIDLLGTIKKTVEKWENINDLVESYKKGKPVPWKMWEAMEKYIKWEISKAELAAIIWVWLVEDIKNNTVENDSILVRFARFLLRLVVILAIPMIIIAGLKVIWSRGDEGKMKDALKQIGYVAIGLLIALASVMIIFLITALTRSSLKFFD